jgi:hypothetical protein
MMNKTALFVRKQSGGMFTVVDESLTTGNIFWVDSGSTTGANSAGYGQNPDAPFLTIDYAVGQCTANNGDIIYVMPGHAEVVSAAGGLDLDVAGITIKGLGRGADQPTVTLNTANTADVDIDAAGITVENIHFVAGFADIVAAIDVNAVDFTLRNCRMSGDNAGLNALIWVQDAAAAGSSRITIENCYCEDRDTSNTHFVNFAGTGNGHRIVGNVLHGDFGTIAVGGAGVVTNCYIADNIINNAANTVDSCINLAATATGSVVRNLCAGAAAQANGVTATACLIAENYYGVLAEDLSAILDPIAT